MALLTAFSAPDVVRTCRDSMTSLQAPGAQGLLWVNLRLLLMVQARGESPELCCSFQWLFRSVNKHKPPTSLESCYFPSLFLIFSFIKDDRSTHPSLTSAVSISFPSHDIRMSDIHTFVTGISSPLPPLKMNRVLSCTCTVCCRRVIPSINNIFRAVLVRGYTRHSPRISCAPSIVSAPLTLSAARHSSNAVSYTHLTLPTTILV